ncbi:MAG: flavin reductase [Acutalibacteraceae bacterium]
MSFKEIKPAEIVENPFKLIGTDWMLVTAEDDNKTNMMTASWGGLGIMWNKPVAYTFIRPQRYTFGMLEKGDLFSLCILDNSYRDVLKLCGTKSGRDIDKVAETGLTVNHINGVPYFEESKLVLVCRKMYSQMLNEESVIDTSVLGNYNGDDWHKMYINEIVNVLVKE